MFSKSDIQGDNLHRLSCIVMSQLGEHPLQHYNYLSYARQKEFENKFDNYIKALPNDWQEVITQDFNEVINRDVFSKGFNPAEYRCDEVITDVQHIQKPKLERDTSLNIISIEGIDESKLH